MKQLEPLYTAEQIAEAMNVHPRTVYRWGRQNKIRRVKIENGSVRFYMPKEGVSK